MLVLGGLSYCKIISSNIYCKHSESKQNRNGGLEHEEIALHLPCSSAFPFPVGWL